MQGNNFYTHFANDKYESRCIRNPMLTLHYLDDWQPNHTRMYVVDKRFIWYILTRCSVRLVSVNTYNDYPRACVITTYIPSLHNGYRCYHPTDDLLQYEPTSQKYLINLIREVIKELVLLRRTVVIKLGEKFNLPDEVQKEIGLYTVTNIGFARHSDM